MWHFIFSYDGGSNNAPIPKKKIRNRTSNRLSNTYFMVKSGLILGFFAHICSVCSSISDFIVAYDAYWCMLTMQKIKSEIKWQMGSQNHRFTCSQSNFVVSWVCVNFNFNDVLDFFDSYDSTSHEELECQVWASSHNVWYLFCGLPAMVTYFYKPIYGICHCNFASMDTKNINSSIRALLDIRINTEY